MKLHTYFRSSAAFRVRIALNLKGLDYESAPVHLVKGEHRAAAYAGEHPQALLPSLEDAGHWLSQSLAIIEYLEETRPNPPLLPADPIGRARVRSLALLIACEIHPLNNLRVLKHLRKEYKLDEEGINTWYRHWIADGMQKLEADLAGSGSAARFSYGDLPGMADCCLVPQIFNAQRYQCDLAPYPTVMRIFGNCMQMDAFQRAEPSRQPDAE